MDMPARASYISEFSDNKRNFVFNYEQVVQQTRNTYVDKTAHFDLPVTYSQIPGDRTIIARHFLPTTPTSELDAIVSIKAGQKHSPLAYSLVPEDYVYQEVVVNADNDNGSQETAPHSHIPTVRDYSIGTTPSENDTKLLNLQVHSVSPDPANELTP